MPDKKTAAELFEDVGDGEVFLSLRRYYSCVAGYAAETFRSSDGIFMAYVIDHIYYI